MSAALLVPVVTASEEAAGRAYVFALYRETARPLRATLQRLSVTGADVDDMLQDTFVIALGRPEALARAQSPRAWIYGIALKVAARRQQRHRLRAFLGLDAVAPRASAGTPHTELEQREATALVHSALQRLAPKKRDVFVLYELDGLTGEEIAEAVGAPLKTVWTRLYHARRELNAALQRRVGHDA